MSAISRAFGPPALPLGTLTQGVALGWDNGAPLALGFVGDFAAFPTRLAARLGFRQVHQIPRFHLVLNYAPFGG